MESVAQKSGLGWIGKHTNLIIKIMWCWVFLGEIILNINLIMISFPEDLCGTCTAYRSCPTKA